VSAYRVPMSMDEYRKPLGLRWKTHRAACTAILFLLVAVVGCDGEKSDRPNVLLISIDTLRMDHTSLAGYERDTTPALAEWAKAGVVFEQAYSASSWTLPGMSMLLTGQVQVENEGRIFPRQAPLAETMRERGYRTGAVIANPLLTSERGFDRGFDYFNIRTDENPQSREWLAPGVTERGIEFMSKGEEPFCLLLHYFDPHDPYLPIDGINFPPFGSEERYKAFQAALPDEDKPKFSRQVYTGIEKRIAAYDAEVFQTDFYLAQLFEWMDDQGLSENTIVIVTADHGEGLWQRAATIGETPKEVFFPELYFEHGVQLYGEQIHVPLVFRGPGVPVGVRNNTAFSLLDVVPTILSLLDLPVASSMPGMALLPEIPKVRTSPVFSICSRGRSVTVDSRYRLHQPREYKIKQGQLPELFDIVNDPLELTPLEDPAMEERLRGLITDWVAAGEAIDWGDIAPIDMDKLREEMHAVGYVAEDMFGEDIGKSEGSDEKKTSPAQSESDD
jgi:choline-sulfatase